MEVCAVHQVPMNNGKCPLCEEKGTTRAKSTQEAQRCPVHGVPVRDGVCPQCASHPTPMEEEKTVIVEKCPQHKIPLIHGVCPECGGKPTSETKQESPGVCPSCGLELLPQARFCVHCGAEISEEREEKASLPENPPIVAPLSPIATGGNDVSWHLIEETKGVSHALSFQHDKIGLHAVWKHLHFYTFPACAFLWVINREKQPVYVFLSRPSPLNDGDIVRFGEIPFLFHYAGAAATEKPGVPEDALKTVFGPMRESSPQEAFLLDCMECLHPNFQGRILNLEENNIEIDRGGLALVLGVRRESLLARAGVSSTPARLRKDQRGIWWIIPPSKPTISLQVPRYFFQLLPGDRIEVEGKWFRVHRDNLFEEEEK